MLNEIVQKLKDAQDMARSLYGAKNILQPGLIKELIMANELGHSVITDKNLPDAQDDSGNYYEYLSATLRNNGSSFQLDRMNDRNLYRINRNKCFYFAMFKDCVTIHQIWVVETESVLNEAKRQISKRAGENVHVNFTTTWVGKNGNLVMSV
jgi:hypothetical protein